MTTVPRWDLAPKLNRPLSLWKPQDYALILYWVFFFPQALKWYERTYCPPVPEEWKKLSHWQQIRKFLVISSPQRNFWLQGQLAVFFTNLIFVPTLAFGLVAIRQQLGYEIDWLSIMGSVLAGPIGGTLFTLIMVRPFELLRNMMFLEVGLMFGLMFSMVGFGQGSLLFVFPLFLITLSLIRVIYLQLSYYIGYSLIGGILLSGVVGNLTFLGVYLLNFFSRIHYKQKVFPFFQQIMIRQNWFCLPWLVQILMSQLEENTSNGLHNIKELLRYSYQLYTVRETLDRWLSKIEPSRKLPVLCQITEQLALHTEEYFFLDKQAGMDALFLWYEEKPTLPIGLMWQNLILLFIGYAGNLQALLEKYPQLMAWPFAPALYQRLKALNEISEPDNIQEISHWYVQSKWLEKEADETFRPHFLATLRQLHHIAGDVHIAHHSLSKLRRSAALGRASGDLQSLEQNLTTICSPLEQKVVLKVIHNWQKVVTQAAGQAGRIEITQPVENPFIVGAPVSGALFVGREDIFNQLEEMWGDDPGRRVDSVVLFGQRRMGKTSILQNVGPQFGAKTVVAFVNLQRLGRLQKEGELWSELAFTIYEALQQAGLAATLPEPTLESFLAHPTHEMNRFIAKVRPVLSGRRLILALDEFEELEKKMLAGEIPAGAIDFLRGLIHSEPWLVVVLAGLHTLEEMTQNYWHPLFASVRPVRVGFLTENYVGQLLANPHEDFPLDISREAAGFIHQWTAGQPLLVQLTGSRLVRLYNQILFEQGVKRSEQFTVEDVQAVMFDPEFFSQGSGYFLGVWGQTEPGAQQQLLIYLAGRTSLEQPAVAEAELLAGAGLDPAGGAAALAALQQRDIIALEKGQVRFTVPLLRYWVKEVLSKRSAEF